MQPRVVTESGRTLRAEVASALAAHLATDSSLAAALAIHEEWTAGYLTRLLINSELLAVERLDIFGRPEPALPPDEAVARAIEAANPWSSIPQDFDRSVSPATGAALVELARAYASFHATAGELERRTTRRGAPEEDDPIVSD